MWQWLKGSLFQRNSFEKFIFSRTTGRMLFSKHCYSAWEQVLNHLSSLRCQYGRFHCSLCPTYHDNIDQYSFHNHKYTCFSTKALAVVGRLNRSATAIQLCWSNRKMAQMYCMHQLDTFMATVIEQPWTSCILLSDSSTILFGLWKKWMIGKRKYKRVGQY